MSQNSILQPARGTRDLMNEDCRKFRKIEDTGWKVAQTFGFEEIRTPIFESSSVFKRSLGDTSDIVSKEMYCFEDIGGDELVLRPEGTASIARAFISEGLAQSLPLKLFYCGPMFRRERPQKGRYRQFYQMGVELLGVEKPAADIEMIVMASQILNSLKIQGNIELHINTLGDQQSRNQYRDRLVTYFSSRLNELSETSKARLDKNPLRILDSKDEGDKKLVAEAPMLRDSLTSEARAIFDEVLEGLSLMGIPYIIDQKLVRGLDYYCHSVFEFTTDGLGAQNTVLAGGRYDQLIQDLGGPRTPGIGWAAGVDRLALLMPDETLSQRPVSLIPLGAEAEKVALKLSLDLRKEGIYVDLGYSGNLSKRMKRANKLNSKYAVVFGSDELNKNSVQLKNLDSGEQSEIPFDEVRTHFWDSLHNPS